ncbi:hypothetical protein P3S67_029644 [Capsicum chacoense]
MRKASKRSRGDEEKRRKKAGDEAAGVSTKIVSTPTTIGVNVAAFEATGASPHFTNASSE